MTGGLIGEPLNVVRAKTEDLLVPAEAENMSGVAAIEIGRRGVRVGIT